MAWKSEVFVHRTNWPNICFDINIICSRSIINVKFMITSLFLTDFILRKQYWILIRNSLGRVSTGVGHLAHVWSYGVRKVVSSNPDRGNIVGWVFHLTRWLARFSLIWICLSFQILNLLRTLSSWWSGNYRPSAPLLYEVASHVK